MIRNISRVFVRKSSNYPKKNNIKWRKYSTKPDESSGNSKIAIGVGLAAFGVGAIYFARNAGLKDGAKKDKVDVKLPEMKKAEPPDVSEYNLVFEDEKIKPVTLPEHVPYLLIGG